MTPLSLLSRQLYSIATTLVGLLPSFLEPCSPSFAATSLNVTATKEVILSAGSYGTPQLLLLSGIGNATELEGLGIQPIVDLPSVGKNLTDHPLVSMQWNVTEREVVNV